MNAKKQMRRRHRAATVAAGLATVAGLLGGAASATAGAPMLTDGASRPAAAKEQRHAWLRIDGIFGPKTWRALFGAKPHKATRSKSMPSAGPSAATSSTGGYTIPSSIVSCESGGNFSAVNPSSGAGGAYQILPSTWHAYGGQGLPQDASPAEQGRIAAEIYASQGRSAWSC